jgi:hypothetical protein
MTYHERMKFIFTNTVKEAVTAAAPTDKFLHTEKPCETAAGGDFIIRYLPRNGMELGASHIAWLSCHPQLPTRDEGTRYRRNPLDGVLGAW